MNLLDENVPHDQREQLLRWRFKVRQIGHDVARAGIQDREILTLLHRLHRPTLFTRDADFADRHLCHPAYGLVFMDIRPYEVAEYVRRVLRHPAANTQAKRMGALVRISPGGVRVWRRTEPEQAFPWS